MAPAPRLAPCFHGAMGWTRREAIAGAGAALLALRAGTAGAMPVGAPAPLRMARGSTCGRRRPLAGRRRGLREFRKQPWAPPLIARASLIRFWADWPVLQPEPTPLEDPANPGYGHLVALDGQIDAARADGLDVIVMPYRYPLWVTGATRWRWGVGGAVPAPRIGPRPVLAVGGVLRGALAPLRGADDALRGRQRAQPPAHAAGPDARADRRDGRDRRRDRPPPRPRRHLPGSVVLGRRLAAHAAADGAAAGVRRPDTAARSARRASRAATTGSGRSTTTTSPRAAATARRGCASGSRGAGRGGRTRRAAAHVRDGGRRAARYIARRRGAGADLRAGQAEVLARALARAEATPGLGLYTQYTVNADPDYDCGLRETDGRARPSFGASSPEPSDTDRRAAGMGRPAAVPSRRMLLLHGGTIRTMDPARGPRRRRCCSTATGSPPCSTTPPTRRAAPTASTSRAAARSRASRTRTCTSPPGRSRGASSRCSTRAGSPRPSRASPPRRRRAAGSAAAAGADELWPDGDRPDRHALDAVLPDTPVALRAHDSHSLWLNSAALALAGGDLETPGGVVERDAAGEPTGILREEAAWRYEARFAPEPAETLDAMRAAMPAAPRRASSPCTTRTAGRAPPRCSAAAGLPLRVWQSVPADAESLEGGDYVKAFMDGTLGSRTARLLDGTGIEITSAEALAGLIRRAAAHGLPLAVHAIGDRANRDALDAFAATRADWRGLRPRIEHAQCIHPADVPRFAELASPPPSSSRTRPRTATSPTGYGPTGSATPTRTARCSTRAR